jgi:hypothetical protein
MASRNSSSFGKTLKIYFIGLDVEGGFHFKSSFVVLCLGGGYTGRTREFMTPELLNELKKTIEPLLRAHNALIKQFIPAKAGLAPELAKKLEPHIAMVEKAIKDLEHARTTEELKAAINAANALFISKPEERKTKN